MMCMVLEFSWNVPMSALLCCYFCFLAGDAILRPIIFFIEGHTKCLQIKCCVAFMPPCAIVCNCTKIFRRRDSGTNGLVIPRILWQCKPPVEVNYRFVRWLYVFFHLFAWFLRFDKVVLVWVPYSWLLVIGFFNRTYLTTKGIGYFVFWAFDIFYWDFILRDEG